MVVGRANSTDVGLEPNTDEESESVLSATAAAASLIGLAADFHGGFRHKLLGLRRRHPTGNSPNHELSPASPDDKSSQIETAIRHNASLTLNFLKSQSLHQQHNHTRNSREITNEKGCEETNNVDEVDDNASSKEDLKAQPGDIDTTDKEEEQEEGEIFGSKADLQLHTQIHMREAKPYKCAQCNKAFANSSYLSQHTRIHLGIKPYKCEICQRKFTQLSHLQQHIRTHTGDKPYKCRHPGCTKAFSQLSNLQSHSRCHQTDKPYKCNSCYKCFTDEAALLEHIPKHKESKHLKTHICQYCGKSYTQETYLAKHMQKHSDRPDKRPAIHQGQGTAGTQSGQTGQGGQSGQNGSQSGGGAGSLNNNNNATSSSSQAAAAAAAAAAAGLTGMAGMAGSQSAGSGQLSAEAYWPKVDPATAAAYAAHDRDYGSLMDPRLNPHARDMHSSMEDQLRHHGQFAATGNGGYDQTTTGGGGNGNIKTSSAFSPIQGSMLQSAAATAAAGGFMGAGSRGYSFYDPIGFPKHHSQVGFDSKPGSANCFPNQLISLSQIRNYAHQPSSDLLHSLKEKATQ